MEPQDLRDVGPCPSDADLVRASTRELTPDEWRVVRPHLDHCPKCRARMRAILNTLSAYSQLEDIDSPERLQAGHERLKELMAAARADREAVSPRRWLAVAAALIAFVAGSALFRDWRAYADEVLARAAQRERAITMPNDLWRLKFIPSADARTAPATASGVPGPGFGASTSRDNAGLPERAVHVLKAHGFDLTQPMSLARLQTWRASQPDRREQVTHRNGWLVVQSATRGPLSQVELVIDEASYQVLKQTWLIAGVGRVVCERVRIEERSGAPPRDGPRVESRAGSGR